MTATMQINYLSAIQVNFKCLSELSPEVAQKQNLISPGISSGGTDVLRFPDKDFQKSQKILHFFYP